MNAYDLTFRDGYKVTVIGTFDDMICGLDEKVKKHGECTECLQEVSYNKYTGTKCEKIW